MTVRTWVGGGTNNIFSPTDWTPAGIPVPGDTLVMANGTANLYGGDLTGVTFLFGVAASFSTANPVLNVYDGARVTLTEGSAAYASAMPTVNVYGDDMVNLVVEPGADRSLVSTVDLAPQAGMTGSIQFGGYGNLTILGGTGSWFDNTGTSLQNNAVAKIDADVIGTGAFNLSFYAGIEFGGAVSSGQTLNLANAMTFYTVDDPSAFHAKVDWLAAPSAQEVALNLLNITADSYTFSNDSLTLFAGQKTVDTLHLHANAGAFVVLGSSTGITLQSVASPINPGEQQLSYRV